VTFKRDGFKEMYNLTEADQASAVIVKDMSRLGRKTVSGASVAKKKTGVPDEFATQSGPGKK
jgi:DNA invertase Pin-like site-specific DNA recombinase